MTVPGSIASCYPQCEAVKLLASAVGSCSSYGKPDKSYLNANILGIKNGPCQEGNDSFGELLHIFSTLCKSGEHREKPPDLLPLLLHRVHGLCQNVLQHLPSGWQDLPAFLQPETNRWQGKDYIESLTYIYGYKVGWFRELIKFCELFGCLIWSIFNVEIPDRLVIKHQEQEETKLPKQPQLI